MAGAAMLAWMAASSQAGAGGDVRARAVVILAPTLVASAAAAMGFLRAHWLPQERRLAWLLLAGACLAWGLGGVSWAHQELWLQRDVPLSERALPFPSVADVGFLLLLPMAASALLVMVIGSTQATTRVRTFLDGVLITSALVFASHVLFLRDILEVASGLGLGARWIALAYPVGDVFLLGLLVLVASRSVPQVRRTLAYLAAAVVALIVADAGFWVQVADGAGTGGDWTDLGWLAAFLLIGYAALRPIPHVLPHEPPRPGLWLSALPLAPFVVSTSLAMLVQVRDGALPPFLFWNAIVVVGTLAVRQFVMVHENLQLRRESEAALQRAQDAHRQRTRLLHSITHDLQNPLSPIQIQLQLLEAPEHRLGDDVRRRLAMVSRNVEHIKRLVTDLNDVAKIQDGRLALVRAPMDLSALVRDVADSFRPLATERGLALDCEADHPVLLVGDALRLRQVLVNLVSNALKFTPRAGRIVVAARGQGDTAVAEVADTGRGLTPEEAARLFQPFSQVHRAGEVKERGTGLGLYISRSLAEAHGGSLTVSSRGSGQGSTFRLALPASAKDLVDASPQAWPAPGGPRSA